MYKPREALSGSNGWCIAVSNYLVLAACVFVVCTHTMFLSRAVPESKPTQTVKLPPVQPHPPTERTNLPDVIIFRRTKKTGSSSMLEELLRVTAPLGYKALFEGGTLVKEVVRGEGLLPHPRKLLVTEHNAVTRDDALWGRVLIIDTVLDGYRQVTSFCRYVSKVENCDAELIKCLKSPYTLSQRYYRWATNTHEDASTYIDMPLSSAHPALSTTVLRRVFPNATLNVKRQNVAGSACPEKANLRSVYEENYQELERQVEKLRIRFLLLSGYPTLAKRKDISLVEMMDRAEQLERKRYLEETGVKFEDYADTRDIGKVHLMLKKGKPNWERSPDGKINLKNA